MRNSASNPKARRRRSVCVLLVVIMCFALGSCKRSKREAKAQPPKRLDRNELVNETNYLRTTITEHDQQIAGLRRQIDSVKSQISASNSMASSRKVVLRDLLVSQRQQVVAISEEKRKLESRIAQLQEQAEQ